MTTLPRPTKCHHIQLCSEPVFVIGSFRSGTSVLANALGQHSAFWYSSSEANFVCAMFSRLDLGDLYNRADYWFQRQEITREAFSAYVGSGINALFTVRSEGKRWIEKTPRNSLIAHVLAEVFPGAAFVHILRDGRYAVHSMNHFFNAIDEQTQTKWRAMGYAPAWGIDFRTACRTWRDHVRAAMEFQRERPERCLTVRYEELVSNPEPGFRVLTRFLGEPYEHAPANFLRSNRIQSSFPDTSEDPSPRGRSDPWEEWTPEQRRIFLEEDGPAMLEYGLISRDEMERLEHDASDRDLP